MLRAASPIACNCRDADHAAGRTGPLGRVSIVGFVVLLVCIAPVVSGQPAVAQDATEASSGGANALRQQAEGAGLAGPQSAGGQLAGDRAERQRISRFSFLDAALKPAEDAQRRLKDATGLDIGFDYQVLHQRANASLTKNRTAAGGAARILGNWTLLGRGTDRTGKFVFIVEHRHRPWAPLTPAELGFEVGYNGITGTTFNDPGAILTVAYWEQRLGEHLGFAVGRLDPTDFTDILGYGNPRTVFSNLSVLVNPTIAFPDPGMGAAAGAWLSDNMYVGGLVSDANGSVEDVEFFPEGAELFSYGEVGWSPGRKDRFLTNVHVGAWHVDEREKAGVPSSHGIVLSANVTLNEILMPFVRLGYSRGAAPLANKAATVGLIRYFPRFGDLAGVALNWSEPSTSGLRDQITGEAFYRFQVSNHWALTGDVQVLWNPALNPDRDRIVVFGLRSRFDL